MEKVSIEDDGEEDDLIDKFYFKYFVSPQISIDRLLIVYCIIECATILASIMLLVNATSLFHFLISGFVILESILTIVFISLIKKYHKLSLIKFVYGMRLLMVFAMVITFFVKRDLRVWVIITIEIGYRLLFCWTMLSLIHWILNGENVLSSSYTQNLIKNYGERQKRR